MKVRELLSGPDKWVKGDTIRGEARCLWKAIGDCYLYPIDSDAVLFRVRQFIGQNSIVQWNDAPGRTFEEVKALVEKLDI